MSEQLLDGHHTTGIIGVAVPHNPRARRLRSKVWNDFSKERLPDGTCVAVCHHCHKQLTASSRSGTTHLKNHLAICLSTGTRPARGRRRLILNFFFLNNAQLHQTSLAVARPYSTLHCASNFHVYKKFRKSEVFCKLCVNYIRE
jgi:BED zinc finger